MHGQSWRREHRHVLIASWHASMTVACMLEALHLHARTAMAEELTELSQVHCHSRGCPCLLSSCASGYGGAGQHSRRHDVREGHGRVLGSGGRVFVCHTAHDVFTAVVARALSQSAGHVIVLGRTGRKMQ